jgi:ParB-like chromosome segregation protein Spo0J
MIVDKPKIQMIDPRKLKVPDVRITTQWEEDDLGSLGTDIEKFGIEDPLKIADDGTTLWVIDGRHRLEQALLKGLPLAPCIVKQMDLKTQLFRNLASNHLRGTVKVSDEIKVVKELMTAHGANVDSIVDQSGLSRERVETMMLIAAGHPDIITFLDDGRIKLGHAKAIVRIPDQMVQSQLCYTFWTNGSTVETANLVVKYAIQQMEEASNPQRSVVAPAEPATPTCECGCCSGTIPVSHAVSVILCRDCYGALLAANAYAEKQLGQPEQTVTAEDK